VADRLTIALLEESHDAWAKVKTASKPVSWVAIYAQKAIMYATLAVVSSQPNLDVEVAEKLREFLPTKED